MDAETWMDGSLFKEGLPMNEACATSSPLVESRTDPKKRLFLYALVQATPEFHLERAGIGETDVYTVTASGISAVVSTIPGPRLRPERRNLAAHQGVLNRLMESTAPLPMTFGTIAQGEDAVRKMLARNSNAILKQLAQVAGKVEMILRVKWDVPNIFEYFVCRNGVLMAARDQLFGPDSAPTQDDRLEIGRLFERVVSEEREEHTLRVEKALSTYCAEIKRNKCRSELDIMNLACLIPKEMVKVFEEKVLHAAESFDNSFAFDYSGPWPPYNFVKLSLEL